MAADFMHHLQPSERLPTLFIGHGSPMHAIENNHFTQSWHKIGENLPQPSAILVISAHWMTRGTTLVHVAPQPRQIYDFYNFPASLYQSHYTPPGAPEAAQETLALLKDHTLTGGDEQWGLDHGAWCVLMHLFPKANIPVYQLSLDLSRSMKAHFELARELRVLRQRGVLIVASGNMVHNLRLMHPSAHAFDWAQEFDSLVANKIKQGQFDHLYQLDMAQKSHKLAHPSLDHFLPLFYTLGLAEADEQPHFFAEGFDLASISMRSLVFSG